MSSNKWMWKMFTQTSKKVKKKKKWNTPFYERDNFLKIFIGFQVQCKEKFSIVNKVVHFHNRNEQGT